MKYIVTKEIKSETQVSWFLYFQDFVFLAVWVGVNLMLKEQVKGWLQVPFFLFAGICGLLAVLPGRKNPKRRFYQCVMLYVMRPKAIYRNERRTAEDEKEKGKGTRNSGYHRRSANYRV